MACIAVVILHATGGPTGSFFVGNAGVDLFFLISGFIMWTITEEKERKPSLFLWRRLVRIVPLYWFITLAVFAKRSVVHTANVTDLLYSLFFLPHHYADGNTAPLLNPGWTLNYEMFFYLVFAAALFLRRRHQIAVMFGLFGALALYGVCDRPTNLALSTYTSSIILEFIGGIAIAAARISGRLPGPRVGIALCIAALVTLAGEHAADLHLGDLRVVVWGLPGAALLIGAITLEGRAPRLRVLKFLGDASYAIYLVHTPIINLTAPLHLANWQMQIVNVLLGVLVGSALHVVEAWGMRRLRARPLVLATASR